MVQYMDGTQWKNYQSYEDRNEAGRVADFLTEQGNTTRVILWRHDLEEEDK